MCYAVLSFGNHVIHHFRKVPCFIEYFKLAVCTGSVFKDRPGIFYFFPAAQIVYDVIDKFKKLFQQIGIRHGFFFPEIDLVGPSGSPVLSYY